MCVVSDAAVVGRDGEEASTYEKKRGLLVKRNDAEHRGRVYQLRVREWVALSREWRCARYSL